MKKYIKQVGLFYFQNINNLKSMSKKRTVFLLGAGAALDWQNAPSTDYLTKLIRNAGPKKGGRYITDCIFEKFNWNIHDIDSLNFEGLIDIIEQCVQYWVTKDHIPTINNKLLTRDDKFWENIIDYEYVEKSPQTTLNNSIRRCKFNPQAKFFIFLLANIYDRINIEIAKYGRFNSTNNIIECENDEINRLAKGYFFNLSKSNYLRVYSLNYDRIIQYLFHCADLSAFQGFYGESLVPNKIDKEQLVDSNRILTSFNENCIYHLHGNYAWQINATNLPNIPDQIVNGAWGRIASNRSFSIVNTEKYKNLLLSNIITGYSKVQRSNLIPFKQMASAFDIDCHIADEIIIIGYSFGDIHINETIRQAKAANPECKIICISPNKSVKNLVLKNILWNNKSAICNDFESSSSILTSSKHYNCEIFDQSWRDFLLQMDE